jgi:gas vesicle protein
MSARNTFWAFVLGAAAGGAAALLLAPDRGEKTRRRLREGADKTLHDVRGSADKVIHEVRDVVEGTAKDLGHEVGVRKEAVTEAMHTAKETYRRELHKKVPENRIADLTE